MTTYYRGRRRWRRPAHSFVDREHTDAVADLVHDARLKADAEQRAWFNELTGGEHAQDQSPPDPDPAS